MIPEAAVIPEAIRKSISYHKGNHMGKRAPQGRLLAKEIYKYGIPPGRTIPGTAFVVAMCAKCLNLFGWPKVYVGHVATCSVCLDKRAKSITEVSEDRWRQAKESMWTSSGS